MAEISSIDGNPTSGANPWIDALVWGGAWASAGAKITITYSFAAGRDPFTAGSTASGKTWSESESAAVRAAIRAWESVANIDFVELAVNNKSADMWMWLFDDTTMPDAAGISEVPDPSEGPVEPLYTQFNWQDNAWTASGLISGGKAFLVILHELGHALGLAHPHDGGSQAGRTTFPGVTQDVGSFGEFNLNQGIYTTMSYNEGWTQRYPEGATDQEGLQATPMALDIAAIQAIYGANTTYRTGSDTYYLPALSTGGWRCIWDAGGTDTITAEGASGSVTIDLRAATSTGVHAGGFISHGTNVKSGFTIAKGVVIEKAKGASFSDRIIGNGAANTLSGGGGDDRLSGGGGSDLFYGGAGKDSLDGGTGTDTVSYSTLKVGVNASLTRGTTRANAATGEDRLISIDNLIGGAAADQLTGSSGANVLKGSAGGDRLYGLGGNDSLDGGFGTDTLSGGAGNDVFYVQNKYDKIYESLSAGADKVYATVSVSSDSRDVGKAAYIGAHVEQISLQGTAAVSVRANGRANTISGNGAANRLEGLGGNDTIAGAAGNDRIDGGTGADLMKGGTGNDTFVVQNTADHVREYTNAGDDTVLSSVSVSAWQADNAAMAYIEGSITAIRLTGSADVKVRANNAANTITGNSGNNDLMGFGGNDTISGGTGNDRIDGGTGADLMTGGTGNDTFILQNIGDHVVEQQDQGDDTVLSSVSVSAWEADIAAVAYIQGSIKTITLTGSADVMVRGNDEANAITGNSGNNDLRGFASDDTINGGGGFDTLTGGEGADQFVFAFPLGSDVIEITDFQTGSDKIVLSRAVFQALPAGGDSLSTDNFIVAEVAADAGDVIIFNPITAALNYDPDGSGVEAAIVFARLTGLTTLAAADFVLA
jgi:serralysin